MVVFTNYRRTADMSQTRAGQPLHMVPSLARTKDAYSLKTKERREESEDEERGRGRRRKWLITNFATKLRLLKIMKNMRASGRQEAHRYIHS